MENDRPIKALAAELTDMAALIENTKPQGVLYDSVLPSMREAAAAITRLEGERERQDAQFIEVRGSLLDTIESVIDDREKAKARAEAAEAEVERLKSDIAAPAMLEALRSAAAFIGEEADNREYAGSEHSDYEREPRDLVNRINAAIDLATG